MATLDSGEFVMDFGKHKGEFIKDVPASYLHWAYTSIKDLNQNVIDYVEENLKALQMDHPDGIWERP